MTAPNERPDLSVRPDTPSWQLIATLAVAGAVAGLLIVAVHLWTQPRILEHQARALAEAVQEVLGDPVRTEKLYVIDGTLTPELPDGLDSLTTEKVFVGYAVDDRRLGIAISGGEPGFQDVITVIFGFDPDEHRVIGMKVLDNKETPGLGDKIVKDSAFVAEFAGVSAPLIPVKIGAGSGSDDEVDMITGATISSKAVIAIINHRIEAMSPLVDAYLRRQSAALPASPTAGPGGEG